MKRTRDNDIRKKASQTDRPEEIDASGRPTAPEPLRAYVLVQTVPGRVEGVKRSLARMPSVSSVDSVTGPYDLVALLEVEEISEFSHLVAGVIGGLRGVTRTTTLICS